MPEHPLPLEVHDLTVTYDKRPALYGVDLEIGSGQIVGVLGPNGAGKSTLIKTIMGVQKPISGWVKIFGLPLNKAITRIGYVPQRESVDWDFPVTVFDVVMMGRYGHLGLMRRPRKQDKHVVMASLEKVGMVAFKDKQIAELSGGQQQRIFLARALAQESDLYLLDEPFAGVDAATEAAILGLLKGLREEGKTMIVVHHDLVTAKQYFDQLILLNMRLVKYGATDAVFTPDNLQKTYGGRLTILSEVADTKARTQSQNQL